MLMSLVHLATRQQSLSLVWCIQDLQRAPRGLSATHRIVGGGPSLNGHKIEEKHTPQEDFHSAATHQMVEGGLFLNGHLIEEKYTAQETDVSGEHVKHVQDAGVQTDHSGESMDRPTVQALIQGKLQNLMQSQQEQVAGLQEQHSQQQQQLMEQCERTIEEGCKVYEARLTRLAKGVRFAGDT